VSTGHEAMPKTLVQGWQCPPNRASQKYPMFTVNALLMNNGLKLVVGFDIQASITTALKMFYFVIT